MIKILMKKYAVSRDGAKGMLIAIAAGVCVNLALMLPVALLYVMAGDMMAGSPLRHAAQMAAGIVLILAALGAVYFWQYNATFFFTYKESGAKRIALAEKLRKLPLNYFSRKDSADLTTVILSDVEKLEHTVSHQFSQFYSSVISTLIVSAGFLLFDWRMALAAIWMLPFSLGIVFFSGGFQKYFSLKASEADVAAADGIQECIEASRDLKSANAEKRYLKD